MTTRNCCGADAPRRARHVDRKVVCHSKGWGQKRPIKIDYRIVSRSDGVDARLRAECCVLSEEEQEQQPVCRHDGGRLQWANAPMGQYKFWLEAMGPKSSARPAPFIVQLAVDGIASKKKFEDLVEDEEKLAFEIDVSANGKWSLIMCRKHERLLKPKKPAEVVPLGTGSATSSPSQ